MNTLVKPEPPALPATINDWHRHLKAHRTINDEVESIHRALLTDPQTRDHYNRLLYAVYDSQTVEGSMSCDNCLAAIMIRDRAKEQDDSHPLTSEKLATITLALGVVLRRYRQSRKQRRNMVAGKIVPENEQNDE